MALSLLSEQLVEPGLKHTWQLRLHFTSETSSSIVRNQKRTAVDHSHQNMQTIDSGRTALDDSSVWSYSFSLNVFIVSAGILKYTDHEQLVIKTRIYYPTSTMCSHGNCCYLVSMSLLGRQAHNETRAFYLLFDRTHYEPIVILLLSNQCFMTEGALSLPKAKNMLS